jgi:hypothetical protein
MDTTSQPLASIGIDMARGRSLALARVRIPIKATAREPNKQAGYISVTSAIYAQSLLRNAAGPYIRVKSCLTAPKSDFRFALEGGLNSVIAPCRVHVG